MYKEKGCGVGQFKGGRWRSLEVAFSAFILVFTGVAHNTSTQSRALFWQSLPQGHVSLQPLNGSSLYLKNFPNRFIIFSITLFHNMMSESENLSEGNVCVKVNAVPCVTRV